MKDNIDLTSNRDFRKRVNLRDVSLSIEDVILGRKKYPWNMRGSVYSYLQYKNELFLTGNKEDRKNKQKSNEYDKGVECERCGKDLAKKPWDSYYRLCKECSKDLDSNRKTTDMIMEMNYKRRNKK